MKTQKKGLRLRFKILFPVLIILALFTAAIFAYAFWDLPPIAQGRPNLGERAGVILIGLISDTHRHIPMVGDLIPERVFDVFMNVDLIIHAGDISDMRVIVELEKIAPIVAVHGSIDQSEIRAIFPAVNHVEVHGWKIGVVHDVGLSWFVGMGNAEKIAKENGFDVLIFGHFHRPFIRNVNGVIYLSPGSPTDPLPPLLTKPTVGLLEVSETGIKPFIVEI